MLCVPRLVGLLGCFLLGSLLFSADGPPEDEPGETEEPGEGKTDAEDNDREEAGPTERESRILELFSAKEKYFKEGLLFLYYDFEEQDDGILDDWKPTLEQGKPRIRWALPKEGPSLSRVGEDGTRTSISRPYLVLADNGQFLHKAVFVEQTYMKVRLLNMAQPRSGAIVAPIFYNDKKKAAIGGNAGYQVVCLKGAKPAHALPAIPPADQLIPRRQVLVFGYHYSKGVMEVLRNDKAIADTKKAPRFVDGFETGRAGIAWNGSVQCFVMDIRIVGKLDPDWVEKELGEKKPGKK